jgi:hypothetical protein
MNRPCTQDFTLTGRRFEPNSDPVTGEIERFEVHIPKGAAVMMDIEGVHLNRTFLASSSWCERYRLTLWQLFIGAKTRRNLIRKSSSTQRIIVGRDTLVRLPLPLLHAVFADPTAVSPRVLSRPPPMHWRSVRPDGDRSLAREHAILL